MTKNELEIICLEILNKKTKIPYVAVFTDTQTLMIKAFWILLIIQCKRLSKKEKKTFLCVILT